MTTNVNPKTGIRFGLISASSLSPELVEELMAGSQAKSANPDDGQDDYACEPEIYGLLDGVAYETAWFGGALSFFIVKSPHITYSAPLCSPCAPNAGNLDKLNGSYTCYNVPRKWRVKSAY